MKKITFDQALERLSDGRYVQHQEVSAKALKRVLWVSEWHLPGCISESVTYSTSKGDAIRASLSMAESEEGAPRGMKTALMRDGRFDSASPLFGRVINTIYRTTLGDLL